MDEIEKLNNNRTKRIVVDMIETYTHYLIGNGSYGITKQNIKDFIKQENVNLKSSSLQNLFKMFNITK